MALTKVSNSMLVQPVNHNILINPSFTVKQRGDVIVHANTSYGPDRWKVRGLDAAGGTKVESSTKVDDVTGINKLVVKHEGTTTDTAYVYQSIEAVNLLGLYGKEMTLSFSYSDTDGSGIPKVLIRSWGALATQKVLYDAVPTSLGDNRWTCTFTLSTDGDISDPNEKGLQVTIAPNSDNGGNINNAPSKWSVWETKLEVGSVVTPFIARSYAEELALCHRYYQSMFIQATSGFSSTRRALNTVGICVPLYAVMRGTPSFISQRADGTNPTYTLKGNGDNEVFYEPDLIYGTGFALLSKAELTTTLSNEHAYVTSVQSGYYKFDAEL